MLKIKIAFIALALLCAIGVKAQTIHKPVPVILDSDMGPDYDDVGAITILHALADNGEAKILATMASTKYPGVAGVFSVFNTYFNRPDLPIGVPKGEAVLLRDRQHWSDTILARYPHKIKTNDEALDAVKLYRKILAKQPDHSVTLITIGFFTNLSNLLKTGADEYSPLTGEQLVRKKVKRLVSMAGKFPSGWEFNVDQDTVAAKNVFEHWPTSIIFSGFEIGAKIMAGIPLIHNTAIENDPVKDVFRISIPQAIEDSIGRKSWDETAVLIAVRGYSPYYTLHKGHIILAQNGMDTWNYTGNRQAYVVEKVDYREVERLINRMIMHQPVGKTKDKTKR
jgi:inosine-uridine nucleoside N-ribohydrolase